MNTTATIVAIVTVLGALVLAVRGLQSHRLPREKLAWMAAAWVAIIAALVFILSRMGM